MELIIRAIRGSFDFDPDCVRLYAKQIQGKQRYVAQPLVFKESNVGEMVQPFLDIEKHNAQKLMDDLWDCGIRPSEGSGSAGAMKKTENHLQDMRMITFHKLGIDKTHTS